MILVPRLDKEKLHEFQGKKVILYGKIGNPLDIYKVFKTMDIEVMACCIEKVSLQVYIQSKLLGVLVVRKDKIKEVIGEDNNIIIQSLTAEAKAIEKLKKKAQEMNVEYSVINTGEIIITYACHTILNELRNSFRYYIRRFKWYYSCKRRGMQEWKHFMKNKQSNTIVICSPPKTADISLNYTFDVLCENNSDFGYKNLNHLVNLIDKNESEKRFGTFKIIVGIREPISQNLSRLYQDISENIGFYNWMLGDLNKKSHTERHRLLNEYEKIFIDNGHDLQVLWDAYIKRFIDSDNIRRLSQEPKTIQNFIRGFSEHVIDITKYPFDKEKGYAIMKDGNTEVFVYQLERLNDIVPELSEWIGVPFDKLEKGNAAEDKWIADSYKQALKEIQITQEYFDRCFDEPYVKHCYSESDIEKFKARWRPHIKQED